MLSVIDTPSAEFRQLPDWALDDLRASGLNDHTIRRHGIRVIDRDEGPAIEYPHFDILGRPTGFSRLKPLRPRIADTLFNRRPTTKRFFDPIRAATCDHQPVERIEHGGHVATTVCQCCGKFYGSRPTKEKRVKYEQPAGEPSRAYIPRGVGKMLESDPDRLVVFVEGEKKALAIFQLGYAVVGLSGIWCFQAKRETTSDGRKIGPRRLIPDIANLPLSGRPVAILFDSDEKPETRAKVEQASEEFRKSLIDQSGARPFPVWLPAGCEKMGPDDFVVAYGGQALCELIDLAEIDHRQAAVDEFVDGLRQPHRPQQDTSQCTTYSRDKKNTPRVSRTSGSNLPRFSLEKCSNAVTAFQQNRADKSHVRAVRVPCSCRNCPGCAHVWEQRHIIHYSRMVDECGNQLRLLEDVPRDDWQSLYRRIKRKSPNPTPEYLAVETAPGLLVVITTSPVGGTEINKEHAKSLVSSMVLHAEHVKKPVIDSAGWKLPPDKPEPEQVAQIDEDTGLPMIDGNGCPVMVDAWKALDQKFGVSMVGVTSVLDRYRLDYEIKGKGAIVEWRLPVVVADEDLGALFEEMERESVPKVEWRV